MTNQEKLLKGLPIFQTAKPNIQTPVKQSATQKGGASANQKKSVPKTTRESQHREKQNQVPKVTKESQYRENKKLNLPTKESIRSSKNKSLNLPTRESIYRDKLTQNKKNFTPTKQLMDKLHTSKEFGIPKVNKITNDLRAKNTRPKYTNFPSIKTTQDRYRRELEEQKKPTFSDSIKGLGKHSKNVFMGGMGQTQAGITNFLDMLVPDSIQPKFMTKFFDWQRAGADYNINRANESIEEFSKDSKVAKVAGEVGVQLSAMLPDILMSMGTAGASTTARGINNIPKATEFAMKYIKNPAFWASFARMGGDSYNEAIKKGASENQARAMGTLNGLLGGMVEMSGVQALPQKLMNDTTKKGIFNKVWDFVSDSMLEEGGEEVVQNVTDQLLQMAIYDHNKNVYSTTDDNVLFNPSREAQAFGMGALVGGVAGVGIHGVNKISKPTTEIKENITPTETKVNTTEVKEQTFTNTANDGKFSIETNEKGQKYVKADRQVIHGDNPEQWKQQIYNYINKNIRNGKDINVVGIDGDILTITKDTAGKARFRNYVDENNGNHRLMTDDEYATKLRAESHIDELSEVSKRGAYDVPDKKNHTFAKDGFNYRTAFFEDEDGSYYKVTMSVGKSGEINTVYNVGKIKKREGQSHWGSKASRNKYDRWAISSLNDNTISQDNPIVNNNYMQRNENNSPNIIKRVYEKRTPEMVKMANAVYKKTGINIQQAELLNNGKVNNDFKGFFDGNNTIYVSKNASESDIARSVVMHELTHSIEKTSQYKSISDTVLKAVYGEDFINNEQFKNDIESKMQEYANNNVKIDKDGALNEIVASNVEKVIFSDETQAKRIVESDYTFGQRVYDYIGTLIYNIKSKFGEVGITAELEQAQRNFRMALDKKNKGNNGYSFDATESNYVPYEEKSQNEKAVMTGRINQLNGMRARSKEENIEFQELLYNKFGKDKDNYVQSKNKIESPLYGDMSAEDISNMASNLVSNSNTLYELKKQAKKVEKAYDISTKQMEYIDKIARGEADINEFSKELGLEEFQEVIDAKKKVIECENDGIKKYQEKIRDNFKDYTNDFIKDSNDWRDKKTGFQWWINTPERNAHDTMGKDADKFIKSYITPMKKNEAEKVRYISDTKSKIKELNLTDKEFEVVMKYGEGIINENDIPMDLKIPRIKEAAKLFNDISENIKNDVNLALVMNGYKPIDNPKIHLNQYETSMAIKVLNGTAQQSDVSEKVSQFVNIAKRYGIDSIDYDGKGKVTASINIPYFPHGEIINSIQKVKRTLGFSDDVSELPGEITGRTENFKPNKKWSGNLEKRTGNKTSYDLRNWDSYINDMAEIIYHTSDITKLRILTNQLRSKYSQSNIDDLLVDESFRKDEAIETAENISEHNNLINWLDEYANIMAGKKSILDRGFERVVGRRIYNICNTISRNWAVNQVGFNISSVLNQFSQLTDLVGECNPVDIVTALTDLTLNNNKSARENSSFLTAKNGADPIKRTKLDKAASIGFYLPSKAENFVSSFVYQTKYNEYIRKGFTPKEANNFADTYVSEVMADRTKAGLPIMFNSRNPFVRLLSAFQTEAVNSFFHYIKDLPRYSKEIDGAKGSAWLIKCLIAGAIAKFGFNELKEKLTGGGAVTIDPVGFTMACYEDIIKNECKSFDNVKNSLGENIGNLPFMQLFAALLGFDDIGQIPMSNMVPNIPEIKKKFENGNTSSALWDISDTVINAINPLGGYSQAKKTTKGIKTLLDGGSYNSKGNLMYPVEQTPENVAKGVLFGKNALPGTREYYDEDKKPLSEKETKEYEFRVSKGENPNEVYNDIMKQKEDSKKKSEENAKYREESQSQVKEFDYETSYELEKLKDEYKKKYPDADTIAVPKATKTFSYDGQKFDLSAEQMAKLQNMYNTTYKACVDYDLKNDKLTNEQKYEQIEKTRKSVYKTVKEKFYNQYLGDSTSVADTEKAKETAPKEISRDDEVRNWMKGNRTKKSNNKTVAQSNTSDVSRGAYVREWMKNPNKQRANNTGIGFEKYSITNHNGEISRSSGKAHRGMDFAVPMGTSIQSTVNGTVVKMQSLKNSYGNYVVIKDDNGNYHYYAHLSGFNCQPGQRISRGDLIGRSGTSGNSTGPHLHYEVRQGDNYDSQIDPSMYL